MSKRILKSEPCTRHVACPECDARIFAPESAIPTLRCPECRYTGVFLDATGLPERQMQRHNEPGMIGTFEAAHGKVTMTVTEEDARRWFEEYAKNHPDAPIQ
jgi:Zn-finger nucleic acid-binding protein